MTIYHGFPAVSLALVVFLFIQHFHTHRQPSIKKYINLHVLSYEKMFIYYSTIITLCIASCQMLELVYRECVFGILQGVVI